MAGGMELPAAWFARSLGTSAVLMDDPMAQALTGQVFGV
jgi:hypothetical protein